MMDTTLNSMVHMPNGEIDNIEGIESPWGWGITGLPMDPTEHGRPMSPGEIDQHYNGRIKTIQVQATNSEYNVLLMGDQRNTKTVIAFPKGDGRLYVFSEQNLHASLLFPGSLIDHFPADVNLAIVSAINPLPYDLLLFAKKRFKNIEPAVLAYLIKNLDPVDLMNETILKFYQDFSFLINEIKKEFPGKIILMGHCTSAELMSRYYDLITNKKSISGLILCNPMTNKMMRDSEILRYFISIPECPVMVIQHEEDPTDASSIINSQRICDGTGSTQAKLVALSGGTNRGASHFSLGYHGFRDIEQQVCQEISTFVQKL